MSEEVGTLEITIQPEIEIDERLWAIHREMVDLAQASKTAFVKALAETVSILLQALR